MRKLGCLVFLVGFAIAIGEAYSFVVASRLLRDYTAIGTSWVDTVLPIILIQAVLITVGIIAVRRAIDRMPTALMGSMMGQNADAGRLALQVLGGLFLIIPGFFLDVVGLLLLLRPVQGLFARTGQKVVMALVRRQMGKMFPGGMPPGGGFPGGFGGFPGGPFPGMNPRGPLKPDDHQPRGPTKVIETTAERVDRR